MVDASVPLMLANGHELGVRLAAYIMSSISLIGFISLLSRHVLAIKIGLHLTWIKAIACNFLALLIFAIFVTVLYPLTSLLADEVVPSREKATFDKLVAAASANNATIVGQRFNVDAINDFASRDADMIKACTNSSSARDYRDLDLVLILNKSGDVEDVRMWPKTHIGTCIINIFMAERLPSPPFDGYAWHVPFQFLDANRFQINSSSIAPDIAAPLADLKIRIVFQASKREVAATVAQRIAEMGGDPELIPRTETDAPLFFATLIVNDGSQISAGRALRDKISDIENIRLRRSSPERESGGTLSRTMALWLDQAPTSRAGAE